MYNICYFNKFNYAKILFTISSQCCLVPSLFLDLIQRKNGLNNYNYNCMPEASYKHRPLYNIQYYCKS